MLAEGIFMKKLLLGDDLCLSCDEKDVERWLLMMIIEEGVYGKCV